MNKSLVLLALVTACGASDHAGNNAAAAGQAAPLRSGGGAPVSTASAPASDASGAAGLYQGGNPAQPNQLCIADKGDSSQFGVTVWGATMAACSGAGLARRDGDRLTLAMTGDSACVITAQLRDGKVTFPTEVPKGCAYYCGKRAHFSGAVLTLKQAGAAGAAKALDPAGDPLCG